eukprot:COSAG01_NODE_1859_length_9042_cov_9.585374_6_plen_143_part_00
MSQSDPSRAFLGAAAAPSPRACCYCYCRRPRLLLLLLLLLLMVLLFLLLVRVHILSEEGWRLHRQLCTVTLEQGSSSCAGAWVATCLPSSAKDARRHQRQSSQRSFWVEPKQVCEHRAANWWERRRRGETLAINACGMQLQT